MTNTFIILAPSPLDAVSRSDPFIEHEIGVAAGKVPVPLMFVDPAVVGICVPVVCAPPDAATTLTLYSTKASATENVKEATFLPLCFEILLTSGPDIVTTGRVVSRIMLSLAEADSL